MAYLQCECTCTCTGTVQLYYCPLSQVVTDELHSFTFPSGAMASFFKMPKNFLSMTHCAYTSLKLSSPSPLVSIAANLSCRLSWKPAPVIHQLASQLLASTCTTSPGSHEDPNTKLIRSAGITFPSSIWIISREQDRLIARSTSR